MVKQPELVPKGNQDSCFLVSSVVSKLLFIFFLNSMNNQISGETSHFHQFFSLLHHQSRSFAQMFPWCCQLQCNRPRKHQPLPRLIHSHNCLITSGRRSRSLQVTPDWLLQKYLSAALQTQVPLSHSTYGIAFVLKVFEKEALDLPGCKWSNPNGF